MRLILAGVAAFALAGPASAQTVFTPEAEEDLVRAIPPAAQVEAIGETMDRVLGAVLNVPIGPLVDAIDAADPNGRRDRRSYPRDATVGDMASRDDPYFEDRLRDSIQRNSVNMGRAMEQIAIAAPALRRALGEVESSVERSIDESRERYEAGRERRDPR
ncbi:MAG TPA: hypothetical protein VF552_12410 [Allosphingosinicella sp.]|jgi:hypothetical protein